MKIEFDENNKGIVSAIAVMLNTISGVEIATGTIITETKTVAVGDRSVTETKIAEQLASVNIPDLPVNNGVEVDADGYPWDGRINAKTKTKNADDTWKILRRPKKQFETDDAWKEFINGVRAELKPADELPPPNDFGNTMASTEPEPEPEPEMSFAVLMKFVTSNSDKITSEDFQEICESYEIDKPSDLGKKENKILLPSIYEELQDILSE